MESKILFKDVSLVFDDHQAKGTTFKELFANIFTSNKIERNKHKRTVLNGINIEIAHGERLGIVGRNGAGKSTFLKSLCKIYEPTAGKILIQGSVAPLLEIGAGFNPELSGRENIYLNGAILGHDISELKKLEAEIIDFAELTEYIDIPVKYYSTGMYLKLAFSIATAIKPDILVLDELFAGGDAEFVAKAKGRMEKFIAESSIMVFVSHQLELLQELCTRVIWIDKGRIVADGEPGKVIDMYLNKETHD
ncbi:ABC transporter ATP-binding protein [Cronobacter turicensis]|uniref:ABC transporter ATP-binding protein n=1 Tax=Cronobacter turicensis TaxID=413502 RepID=UPI0011ACB02A|nr:ABC transporter ATP-binding protein [Cronobacter turicensis]EKY3118590.1 ABC transporter ATP-binding protein [Cronobacter turicensis]ELU8452918.1 ABC transporter ATP-binding protein [Cronobacter turicensis]ELY4109700.1 ABC transporter ATP-binding protein [Cronobacter turicensis]ELY4218061.1 ABC transporter ATP-binding protein [Cronobacter turicensis]EMA1789838.1 ABC transporter ATP-binding protein [Cronobacter turicensis]